MINTLLAIQSIPYKHVIDSAHTILETRIILDTLRLPAPASIDLVGKIDIFYNNAWTKLITSFTVIGVIVPALITWYQKRELKLEKDKLQSDIKDSETNSKNLITSTVKGATDEINKKFTDEIAIMKATISKLSDDLEKLVNDKISSAIEGKVSFVVVGLRNVYSLANQKNFRIAVQTADTITAQFPGINVHEIDEYLAREKTTFANLIEDIEKLEITSELQNSLLRMQSYYSEFHTPGTYDREDKGGYPKLYKLS